MAFNYDYLQQEMNLAGESQCGAAGAGGDEFGVQCPKCHVGPGIDVEPTGEMVKRCSKWKTMVLE